MIIESESFVKSPLVTIMMLAYNHDCFIEQAIESILAQQCDFDYEIIIGEDCSTDKTRDICIDYQKKYPQLIKLLLQESNRGLMQNYNDVLELCRGKYICGCADDDYWVDNFKLTKQISFLETNEDYGLIHTAFSTLNVSTNELSELKNKEFECDTTFDELILGNMVGALTKCYRHSLYFQYIKEVNPTDKGWLMEDYPFWLWISTKYKIRYIPEFTAVYRVINTSISNSTDIIKSTLFQLNVAQIREYYARKENKLEVVRKSLLDAYINSLNIFYNNDYFFETENLKNRLSALTVMTFTSRLKLWGLTGSTKHNISKHLLKIYKNIKSIKNL